MSKDDKIPTMAIVDELRRRSRDLYLGSRVEEVLLITADRLEKIHKQNEELLGTLATRTSDLEELQAMLADVSQDDGFRAGYKLAVKEAVAVANIILSEKVDGGERAAIIETIGAIKGACYK